MAPQILLPYTLGQGPPPHLRILHIHTFLAATHRPTVPSFRETLTVHFQAPCFFACTATPRRAVLVLHLVAGLGGGGGDEGDGLWLLGGKEGRVGGGLGVGESG